MTDYDFYCNTKGYLR